ncbi:Metallo-peptidase family M12-domain-containing protein [Spinellus fusiger]|nr:Metallo-peptidase family M12-domain-containing protein [Spinellus fusiger]
MLSYKPFWLSGLYILSILPLSLEHSIDNKRLSRVEPLTQITFEIAPRSNFFFEKRQTTPNCLHSPTARSVEHDDTLRLSIEAFNQTYQLHLEPNTDLFHPSAVTVDENGREEKIRPESFRVYRGYCIDKYYSDERWKTDQANVKRDDFLTQHEKGVLGWARIIVRYDEGHSTKIPIIEGSFRAHGDTYNIKSTSNYRLVKRSDDARLVSGDNSPMVIYRDSDTIQSTHYKRTPKSGACGFDQLIPNPKSFRQSALSSLGDGTTISRRYGMGVLEDPFSLQFTQISSSRLFKRAAAGCPTTRKVNYMGIAADCTYTKYYTSVDLARTQIINDWNTVSAVYESSFNIALGIINITVMNEVCPPEPLDSILWNRNCSDATYTINNRLSDFSQWRGTMSDDGAGLWHLLTQCATGVEVGVAWLSQLCTSSARSQVQNGVTQYVSGTGVSSIIRDEWKVVAHEIGHGFGAIHDCTTDTCPCSGSSCSCCPLSDTQCSADGEYIMNPTSNVSSNAFSSCSISTICNSYPRLSSCLEDPNSRKVQTLEMCGNGLVEAGEECDSGGEETSCCNAATCKLKAGAVCDDLNHPCCNQCQIRPSTFACRPASSLCDVTEYCTGNSSSCPTDQYNPDGQSCGNGLQCASGACTSRDEQCKSRGVSLNVTSACSSAGSECRLYCSNPSASGCIVFNGQFLDGSPCGSGGFCRNGSCDLGSLNNKALDWLQNHKQIAIPVGVVLAIILLFITYYVVRRCCCAPRHVTTAPKPVVPIHTVSQHSSSTTLPPLYPRSSGVYPALQPPLHYNTPATYSVNQ